MRRTAGLWPIVAIPARNEEKRLPLLLAALANQTWHAHSRRPLEVVVVLNNCDDGSRAAVVEAVRLEPRLSVELIDIHFADGDAHVGTARRLAMDMAAQSCAGTDGTAILTTDADAVPRADWVEANLRHLQEVDLVGGHIRGDPAEEAQLGPGFRRRAHQHLRYADLINQLAAVVDPVAHDPWPRHRDYTGASLAVRADVYAAVGGLPALPRREDLAFVTRVAAAGYRIRHPLDVETEVSARLVGRASGGMADCLREWMREEATGAPLLVEDPQRVLARLQRRRRLRQLGDASPTERAAVARDLALDPSAFFDEDGVALSAPQLVELFAGEEPDAPSTVPIDLAFAEAERLLAQIEEIARAA
jgi:GT2 family glycosyltransferase